MISVKRKLLRGDRIVRRWDENISLGGRAAADCEMHICACRGELLKSVAPLFVLFHFPWGPAERGDCGKPVWWLCLPHPIPISILSKVGFLGGSPMMPLFPVWLFAGTRWGRRQWKRGSALVLRKPGVRLTELISGLICSDRFELLEFAFMGGFRSITREVLGTIYLRLTDRDALLLTWQVLM